MDFADHAADLEQRQRDIALARAKAKSSTDAPPIAPGDSRACLDCGVTINPKRLAIKPGATRCTECQTYHD